MPYQVYSCHKYVTSCLKHILNLIIFEMQSTVFCCPRFLRVYRLLLEEAFRVHSFNVKTFFHIMPLARMGFFLNFFKLYLHMGLWDTLLGYSSGDTLLEVPVL